MKILVDCQALQLPSAHFFPATTYLFSVVRELASTLHSAGHECIILLDELAPDIEKSVLEILRDDAHPARLRIWPGPTDTSMVTSDSSEAFRLARNAFVSNLRVDFSLMVGTDVRALSRALAGHLAWSHPRAALVGGLEGHDTETAQGLSRADYLFTLSTWAAKELATLGITRSDIDVVFPQATFPQGSDQARSRLIEDSQVLANWRIVKPCIVFPVVSGDRECSRYAIEAFAGLPAEVRATHQLILLHAQPHETFAPQIQALTERFGAKADEVIAVEALSVAERTAFYKSAAVVLLRQEGGDAFPFSAMEAVHAGALVLAVDEGAMSEVVLDDERLLPNNIASIATERILALLSHSTSHPSVESQRQEPPSKLGCVTVRSASSNILERLTSLVEDARNTPPGHPSSPRRPTLAYVSPLPPARSGIADYSAELLPELAAHYDIELISDADSVDEAIASRFTRRTSDYFIEHSDRYERVVYHFGNSSFHEYMFDLLRLVPGTVVLHDFFLGDLYAYMEFQGGRANAWTHALYASHGYGAVLNRIAAMGKFSKFVGKYPCSFEVIKQAHGVIVHSAYSKSLAKRWYGGPIGSVFSEIPLLRGPSPKPSVERRAAARALLGIPPGIFLVCSFGMLGYTKQNDRLLEAWKQSDLAGRPDCRLVFVGECGAGAYKDQLDELMRMLPPDQIRITQWIDGSTFRTYLEAADIAVQLRTDSRGESSAAVLDTMNYGLPTIVNAHGSMGELSRDAVLMLPDRFTDAQLAEALNILLHTPQRRDALSQSARASIAHAHSPTGCAALFFKEIERFSTSFQANRSEAVKSFRNLRESNAEIPEAEAYAFARTIAQALPLPQPAKQLFLDISALVNHDLHTGIQRVGKSLIRSLIENPPAGYRIEPVFALPGVQGYRYARRFILKMLDATGAVLNDEPIAYVEGDVFVGVDLLHDPIPFQVPTLRRMRNAGVSIQFIVYDMLPVLMPERFPPESSGLHARWLRTIAQFDGAVCISRSVAGELVAWLEANVPAKDRANLKVTSFHLGADIGPSGTKGVPGDAPMTLAALSDRFSFLMVGTVEPRKGHAATLDAFDRLWKAGYDVCLVIVGKEGWLMEPMAQRLLTHSEHGRRLFWLNGCSDEYLELVYAASTCLIASSEGEGFGLPLIEGAQHGLPIIARDIAVFREVAGDNAFYFKGDSAALASAVAQWIDLYRRGREPRSDDLNHLTWNQSAEQFALAVLGANSAEIHSENVQSRLIQARVNGMAPFEFEIHAREDRFISGQLATDGYWEPFETDILRRLVEPGDFVLDLGGNIGWYGVIASKVMGANGKLLTFEPDPSNYALLRRNLALCQPRPQIDARQEAIGDQKGKVKLYLSSFNMGDHHLFDDGEAREFIEVPLNPLDEVLRNEQWLPDIVKSDTQGSEARIIRGARNLFAGGWRPILILEFWPYGLASSGDDARTLWHELNQLGYAMFEVNEERPRLNLLTTEEIERRLADDIRVESQGFINILAMPLDSKKFSRIEEILPKDARADSNLQTYSTAWQA